MPGDAQKSSSPIARSPLLHTEGRPFLITLTAILLILVNLMLLSHMSFRETEKVAPDALVAFGMIVAGFGYWAMRRFGPVLVAICTLAIAWLTWKTGAETQDIIRTAAKFAIYLLPGVIFWDRMK